MEPNFDDHFQRLIHQQAVQAARVGEAIEQTCEMLGMMRANLIARGFSIEGAERIASDMFVAMADAVPFPGGEDDDGGEG